jgi:hypothetical protein
MGIETVIIVLAVIVAIAIGAVIGKTKHDHRIKPPDAKK